MARKRKTIDVAVVRDKANHYLAHTEDECRVLGWNNADMRSRRMGVASLLETVLLDTGNYHGFGYVRRGGEPEATENIQSGNYDDSRRFYR